MTDEPITLFWFRRDLRTNDNHGLYRALVERGNVQPLFIFDTTILEELEDRDDRRVSFIHDRVLELAQELGTHGSSLLVEHGTPLAVFAALIEKHRISAVYTNHDHEPRAIRRDEGIGLLLKEHGIAFHTFKDQTVFERGEVMKEDGTPYTVFTPYMRRWRSLLVDQGLPHHPSEKELHRLHKGSAIAPPKLEELGFIHAEYQLPDTRPSLDVLQHYAKRRDLPAVPGTTRIGVHLRFGTASVRQLVRLAKEHSDTWLNELVWREFFMQVLWHFPHVEKGVFRKAYDAIPWRVDEEGFAAWCEGRTGYPLVDAGMKELRTTGFMHNRVRMVVASFLSKHLLIDWRWGEAWFARWLMDYELASNNGNWQWAAGCGCDAAPYFRVFNPTLQLERFDPGMTYVLKWAPEYGVGKAPEPIVEHKTARLRAVAVYREALR